MIEKPFKKVWSGSGVRDLLLQLTLKDDHLKSYSNNSFLFPDRTFNGFSRKSRGKKPSLICTADIYFASQELIDFFVVSKVAKHFVGLCNLNMTLVFPFSLCGWLRANWIDKSEREEEEALLQKVLQLIIRVIIKCLHMVGRQMIPWLGRITRLNILTISNHKRGQIKDLKTCWSTKQLCSSFLNGYFYQHSCRLTAAVSLLVLLFLIKKEIPKDDQGI